MRARTTLNLALLAAAALLLTLLIVDAPQDNPDASKPSQPLTPLARQDVQRIRIEQADAPAIELRRKDAEWQLIEPVVARAEASEVAPLLRLAETPRRRSMPADEVSPAASGLATPLWTVQINDLTLNIGVNTALDNQRYVGLGDQIILIDEPNTHALEPDYAHFLARRLLPETAEIQALSLPAHRLARSDDGAMTLLGPQGTLSGDDIANTIDAWSRARALWLTASPQAPETEGESISLTLDNGETHTFTIAAREPELRLYSAPLGVTYHLAAHQAPALLDLEHPGSAQNKPALKARPDVRVPDAASQ